MELTTPTARWFPSFQDDFILDYDYAGCVKCTDCLGALEGP